MTNTDTELVEKVGPAPSRVTSGPIPSPGMTAIFRFMGGA